MKTQKGISLQFQEKHMVDALTEACVLNKQEQTVKRQSLKHIKENVGFQFLKTMTMANNIF
jgi:hypothetical protein